LDGTGSCSFGTISPEGSPEEDWFHAAQELPKGKATAVNYMLGLSTEATPVTGCGLVSLFGVTFQE